MATAISNWPGPMPLAHFVPAEDYHQDYLDKHPGGYCHIKLAWADQALSPAENLASQEGL